MTQGGIYENSTFRNIDIATSSRHPIEYPIYIDNERRSAEFSNGTVRNILFEGIRISTSGHLLIGGQNDAYLDRITLKDLQINLTDIIDIPRRSTGKPRGNKTFERDASLYDFSHKNAHLVIGKARNIRLDQISVQYANPAAAQKDQRQLLYAEDVTFTKQQGVEIIR